MAWFVQVMTELMPYSVSYAVSSDKQHRADISRLVGQMQRLASRMQTKQPVKEGDPAIQFLATELHHHIEMIKTSLEKNELRTAYRGVTRISGHCVSCHTRHGGGTAFQGLKPAFDTNGLGPMSRAQYYVATRSFDAAIAQYEKILKNSQLHKQRPDIWMTALQRQMVVSVRVYHHPRLVLELLSVLNDRGTVPKKFEAMLQFWRNSAREWAKSDEENPPRKRNEIPYSVKAMVEFGDKLEQQAKGKGMLHYLRASALLHRVLAMPAKDSTYHQTLFWSVETSQRLADFTPHNMHQAYYSACVRHAPKTALAKSCLRKLQAEPADSSLKKEIESLRRAVGA